MEILWLTIVAGVSSGSIFGLVALTFSAIYNASKVINFAQGEFVMLGALVGFYALTINNLGIPLAFVITVALLVTIGLLFQVLLVAPLLKRGSPIITVIISTMGGALILSGGAGVISKWQWFPVKAFLGTTPLNLGPVGILPQNVLLILTTVLLVGGFWYFSRRTIWGKALRAAGFNPAAASLLGIPISRMMGLAFVISACMAGIGGIVLAPITSPHAQMGFPLVIKGFVSAIIGGLGNPYGAVVGGVLVGLIGAFVANYWSTAIVEIATFALLLAVLMFIPKGLFGANED